MTDNKLDKENKKTAGVKVETKADHQVETNLSHKTENNAESTEAKTDNKD